MKEKTTQGSSLKTLEFKEKLSLLSAEEKKQQIYQITLETRIPKETFTLQT